MQDASPRLISHRRRTLRQMLGTAGILGAAVTAIMLLICLGTLPYTMGRIAIAADVDGNGESASTSSQRMPRRYEAINSDHAMLPPFWSPHAPDERERIDAIMHAGGSAPRPLLGTDRLGRDLLLRCLAGGGISLAIGLAAATLAVVIGTAYGTIAGVCGGRIDAVMMRIVDVLYGLPYILLVVLLAVAMNGLRDRLAMSDASGSAGLARIDASVLNTLTLLIAIGGVSWLTMARVIRGQVLSLKQQPFMEACRAIGVPRWRQFTHHLLPNLLGPIIVYATLTVPAAILSESFLSFLGIGVQEPLPSWGNLAAAGLSELNTVRVRWWLLLWPCAFVGITLLALNFVGEGLRNAFDPKRL